MLKNEVGPLPYITYKYYCKLITELNVGAKTIKLLKENVCVSLRDLGLGNDLDTTQSIATKEGRGELDYVKTKNFCVSKMPSESEKTERMRGKYINLLSVNGLLSRIYKNLQLNTITQLKKISKVYKQTFLQRKLINSLRTQEKILKVISLREMQTKTTVRYCGEMGTPRNCWCNCKMVHPL